MSPSPNIGGTCAPYPIGSTPLSQSIGLETFRLNLTADHLQVTLGELLTLVVLRSTQPPTTSGMGNE